VALAADANQTQLQGTLALARGNQVVESARFVASYDGLHTELPQSNVAMEDMPAEQIVQTLWQAEQSAGEKLAASLPVIAQVAERIAAVVPQGGRVIYVGAGTSGRVAAVDAVEMPCTYSTPLDQFVAVIAGGASDVALTIEENNEEDASSVADLILLQPGPRDVVVGISASGSAFLCDRRWPSPSPAGRTRCWCTKEPWKRNFSTSTSLWAAARNSSAVPPE
jgi:hypothetical protein